MQTETQLKTGDRVNVSVNIKEEWQSKHELYNAIVKEVKNDLIIIGVDNKTTHSDFCPFFNGGYFYTQSFDINLIN